MLSDTKLSNTVQNSKMFDLSIFSFSYIMQCVILKTWVTIEVIEVSTVNCLVTNIYLFNFYFFFSEERNPYIVCNNLRVNK